jgi:hypothetical protein
LKKTKEIKRNLKNKNDLRRFINVDPIISNKKYSSLKALIDTWSQISIVNDKFTKDMEKTETNVTQVDGSVIADIFLCKQKAEIEFKDKFTSVEICRIRTDSYHILLGADWCKDTEMQINWKNTIGSGDKRNYEESKTIFHTETNTTYQHSEKDCIISLKKETVMKPNYRKQFSKGELELVKGHIKDLLVQQKIVPSNSPYLSPIILTLKKPSNEYRMCVDYRKLNMAIGQDAFPMPLP